MAQRLLIRNLPTLMSIAFVFLGLQATGQTLIARLERTPNAPEHEPGTEVSMFDDLPPIFLPDPRPFPEVQWKWTVDNLKPLYARYNVPGDEPSDLYLDAIPVYDVEKGTIGFRFADYAGSGLTEGEYHDNTYLDPHAPTVTYRLPDYDGVSRSQRLVILPKGSEQEINEAIQKGADELTNAITEITIPLFHDDPNWFLQTNFEAAKAEIRELDRPQAVWTWIQLKEAMIRFVAKETRQFISKRFLFGRRSSEIRPDPISMIKTQSSSQNSTAVISAEFSEVLGAFNQLQANISNQLFPVLNNLIAGSNNSIVYQMALSIYSDITLSTQQLIGPFKMGMTAFTYIEQMAANRTNITIFPNGTLDLGEKDTGMKCMLALHSVYEELYLSTWEKAVKATNSTGSLSDLATLNSYLLPKDKSIYPPGWANTTTSFLDDPDFRALAVYANLTDSTKSNGTKRA